jgi:hypothetical protein
MELGPLNYGMLNPYEASILSQRPLRRGDVYRLYRSTLQRFLHGNGMQCPRNTGILHVLISNKGSIVYVRTYMCMGFNFPLLEKCCSNIIWL